MIWNSVSSNRQTNHQSNSQRNICVWHVGIALLNEPTVNLVAQLIMALVRNNKAKLHHDDFLLVCQYPKNELSVYHL